MLSWRKVWEQIVDCLARNVRAKCHLFRCGLSYIAGLDRNHDFRRRPRIREAASLCSFSNGLYLENLLLQNGGRLFEQQQSNEYHRADKEADQSLFYDEPHTPVP